MKDDNNSVPFPEAEKMSQVLDSAAEIGSKMSEVKNTPTSLNDHNHTMQAISEMNINKVMNELNEPDGKVRW